MKTRALLAVMIVAVVALSGCGDAWKWSDTAPQVMVFSVNGVKIDETGQALKPAATDEPPLQVATGASILGYCQASDPNGDALTYTWQVTDGITNAGTSLTGPVFVGKAGTAEGIYVLACSVTDGRGKTVERHVRIRVFNPGLNHAPLASLDTAKLELAVAATHAFTCTASDPDAGDSLSLQWFAQRGNVSPATGSTTTYTAPATAGSDAVYCIVGDGRGAYATAAATVTVK